MLSYCPPSENISFPWVEGGINRCFSNTISVSVACVIAFFPGIFQLVYYTWRGSRIHDSLKPKSQLFRLQYCFHLVIAFLSLTGVLVYVFLSSDRHNNVYGVELMGAICLPISWIIASFVLLGERNKALPLFLRRGHGFVLLTFWTTSFITCHLPLISLRSTNWWWRLDSLVDKVEFSVWIIFYLSTLSVFLIGLKAPGLPEYSAYVRLRAVDANESLSPLIPSENESRFHRGIRHFCLIFPFIWPKKKYLIQLRILLCVIILALGRVVGLYIPILFRDLVNSLTLPTNITDHNSTFSVGLTSACHPSRTNLSCLFHTFLATIYSTGLVYHWDLVFAVLLLRAIQGLGSPGSGLLGGLRAQLWIAVDQNCTLELNCLMFSHLHSLSMHWHLSRKTGEMLRIMDRGTSSVSSVLNYLIFNILPTLIDILIGVIFFLTAFNIWYALLVFTTMLMYTVFTILLTDWRNQFRRSLNQLENARTAKAVDSLLNFETVKYYNAEEAECKRYRLAMIKCQKADWISNSTLNLLNLVQNLIISAGMLIGCLLIAYDVVRGVLTVGDFVLFFTYLDQLYRPLNFFGTYYRMLQTSFIDMENMFDLLDEKVEIQDVPDASDLKITTGRIEFKNVSFHYTPDREIINNVSFVVPPGRTVALVGQTGSGKSTLMRLLFRFYDVKSGGIFIDDQNIAHVTQSSLRGLLGVVPQDTVLFNDTIRYNIQYGRHSATDYEVEAAARSADIHNLCLEFPQGYETIVGERGLKLSGGEKQRVAIARTILKMPRIILLDEATSALDTNTERFIQASINKISENRTTLIIAHRLSTVVHSDEILVMDNGEIVERGSHQQLLTIPNGLYAKLWQKQSCSEESSQDV